MPAQNIPKISAAPTNYKKKKARSSPYKFIKPKSTGKIIKPKPSAIKSTRKSSYGKKKEKKEKEVPKTSKGTPKKKKSEKKVTYYEPPKIRFVRIVSTRSMVPMVGCG
tara:strand:+ start:2961 stop:3284 length:324 start_codon:yes stop_codon:yes gene_type:complete